MDPRDDLDSLADGVDCAACGQFVPTDGIRVLARRDDIAFVEIHCPGCRSESLGIVIASEEDEPADDDASGDVAVGPGHVYGEFGPRDRERFREALPIGAADLDLVHDLLARGGIAALVDGSEPPAAGPGR
jgi:phage FluMu protein Com